MGVTKPLAASVLGSTAIGIVLLLVAVPPERELPYAFDRPTPETIRYADALLASSIARFLDPGGHDRLEKARAIESRIYAGAPRRFHGLELDLTDATNAHTRAIHASRDAALAAFVLIFLASLIGFVLWLADSRSGLWLAARAFLAMSALPILATLWDALLLGLSLLGLLVAAVATIGRQSAIARRVRAAEEVPERSDEAPLPSSSEEP